MEWLLVVARCARDYDVSMVSMTMRAISSRVRQVPPLRNATFVRIAVAERPTVPPRSRTSMPPPTVPTAAPESDRTLEWAATTAVIVRVAAGDQVGLGYAYTDAGAARTVPRAAARTPRHTTEVLHSVIARAAGR
jgi:hypothetical protein